MNIASKKLMTLALAAAFILPVSAQAANQDVVRDVRGNAVTDSDGDCVLTQWDGSGMCVGNAVSVYFEFNKSSLTAEARGTLDEIVSYINNPANSVKSINIVGYADAIGGDSYNQRLSEKRAKRVKSYLSSKGYTGGAALEVRGLGEADSSEEKCSGLSHKEKIDCLWEDRRVDVELNM